jgi:quinolinate synthase
MKLGSLAEVLHALQCMEKRIELDARLIEKAAGSLSRMLAV